MSRPVHFEIYASDPERAITFYATVFEWSFERWGTNPYWLVSTGEGPGIDGGLTQRDGPEPAKDAPLNACPLTMDVEHLDAALRNVEQAGGTIAEPRRAIPGVGWVAYCRDTEGNLFGLMENDPSAE
ncbi:glyoxalase [Prauserella sp. PE36]|uniref:VOC family protein n=1 Tax=Prauserella endophytica TaxID=1592324 RepID=A0ABY2RY52_9PSEU|nr:MULTISPECIES: VOC family protein [Prauserella]PXY24784.1 glyoxalase [Prauserella coralliicola]RBM22945.1 glyoxalase [Prauserella sp. PE36]TKG65207.1 VOC family protein [Prauserella endophytica]